MYQLIPVSTNNRDAISFLHYFTHRMEVSKTQLDKSCSVRTESTQASEPVTSHLQRRSRPPRIRQSQENSAKCVPTPDGSPTHGDKTPPSKPSLAAMKENKSRRIKYVHSRSAENIEDDKDDRTLKGEGRFLRRIERYKDRRLRVLCVCPVTKWLLIKERLSAFSANVSRLGRGCFVVCCPPLCYTLPRIAFWPPPKEYYFYREPPNYPPRKADLSPAEELQYLRHKKQQYVVMKRADKHAVGQSWRIGLKHACAEEIEGVEAFVVKTSRNNFIGCVRVPVESPRFHVLYSHPNASDISDHLVGVPNLIDMSRFYHCDIYSYDYSGFGVSTGSANEKNQNADIRAVFQHMTETLKIPSSQIVVLGYSIGTSASVDLLKAIKLPVAGLILQAPPTSILRVLLWGRACIGLPYKKKSCCADRFSTFDKIGSVTVPVLVMHGLDDVTVPIVHGKIVCQRAVNRATPLWVRCQHDNLENCREVWLRIRDFLKKDLGGGSMTPTKTPTRSSPSEPSPSHKRLTAA